MKKIAYSIVCSTGLVLAGFAPNYADRCAGVMFAFVFGACCIITNEK